MGVWHMGVCVREGRGNRMVNRETDGCVLCECVVLCCVDLLGEMGRGGGRET